MLIPSGTSMDSDVKHMFVVCTEIDSDGTCILNSGCHKFIKKKSHVLYRKSRIEHKDTLLKGIDNGLFIEMDFLDGDVLAEIIAGFKKRLEKI